MNYFQVMEYFGTQTNLAQAIKVRQATVSDWKQKLEIPDAYQKRIEEATHGKLRVREDIGNEESAKRVESILKGWNPSHRSGWILGERSVCAVEMRRDYQTWYGNGTILRSD